MDQNSGDSLSYGASSPELKRIRNILAAGVSRNCPPWLASDSEDIVQEAFLKVMNILKGNEGKTQLSSSYLWRVAYSATIDEIRRRRRRREVGMDAEIIEKEAGSSASSSEHRSVGTEIGRGIRDCMAGLLPERRRALTLRLLGHSIREAGDLLGWPFKRTENLIYRGLADLRKCLEGKGLKP